MNKPTASMAEQTEQAEQTNASAPRVAPARRKPPVGLSWRTMALVGVRMMFHDKLKMLGTLFGVIFAVVLTMQQAGTFFGLLYRNTMFVDHARAAIWILPPATQTLQPGKSIPMSATYTARTVKGVAWADRWSMAVARSVCPAAAARR